MGLSAAWATSKLNRKDGSPVSFVVVEKSELLRFIADRIQSVNTQMTLPLRPVGVNLGYCD